MNHLRIAAQAFGLGVLLAGSAACSSGADDAGSAKTGGAPTSTIASTTSSDSSTQSTPSTTSPATSEAVTSTSASSRKAVTSTKAIATATTGTPSRQTYTCNYEEGTAPCTYSEYVENQKAYASYTAQNNPGPSQAPTTRAGTSGLDANGFALGGPAYPAGPSDYDHPSKAECSAFLTQLRAWADYQNTHRPAGYNKLPTSGDMQYLSISCNLSYFG